MTKLEIVKKLEEINSQLFELSDEVESSWTDSTGKWFHEQLQRFSAETFECFDWLSTIVEKEGS